MPPVPSGRGAFIVLEGLDRSGKTTQCTRLVERLRAEGYAVVDTAWRFPDRETPVGGLINSVLSCSTGAPPPDARALHLLFTANRWERTAELRSLLESGVTVVADRYAYSGVAYSVAANGVPLRWARDAESGLVAADVVVFLRVDPVEAAARGGYGDERYEKLDIQRRVGALFEDSFIHAAQGEGGRGTSGGIWKVVEVGKGKEVDTVAVEVWDAVSPVLDTVTHQPIRVLWE